MRLDVYSDPSCPWCFVGRRNLQLALRDLGAPVEVRWRAFQLNPGLPPLGRPAAPYYRRLFGSDEAFAEAHERARRVAAGVGIDFSAEPPARVPNTLLAQRASAVARGLGRQDAMVEALFRGHFCDGADLADAEQLVLLAERHAVGIDAQALAAALAGDGGAEEVAADLAEARSLGISGVPCFVTDEGFGLIGAHPPGALVQLLTADAPVG